MKINRLLLLVRDNISSLRRGQSKHYIKKIVKLFLFLIAYPLSFIINTFDKKYHFRFGNLHASSYGVFIISSLIYYSGKERYKNYYKDKKVIDILGHESTIANKFYLKKLKEKKSFIILEKLGLAFYLVFVSRALYKYIVPIRNEFDLFGDTLSAENFITFTEEEKKEGEKFLQKIKATENNLVTIHVKDKAFSIEVEKKKVKKRCVRCADIKTFSLAIKDLNQKNMFPIRMGARQDVLSECEGKVFDYSNSGLRSEMLDFFIVSRSKLFIGTDSGFCVTPFLFKIPMLLTNVIKPLDINFILTPNSLLIHKKLFSKKLNRFLSYKEIFSYYRKSGGMDSIVGDLDVEFIDNSEDEILKATNEIYNKINGVDIRSEKGKLLQERYWKIVDSFDFSYHELYSSFFANEEVILPETPPIQQSREVFNINIAASFLEENQYLFD